MRIIAFAGLAQAGKTTVAEITAATAFNAGYVPKMDHFAGPLKRAAEMVGAHKSTNPALYRKVCQYLGSSFRDPDFVPEVTGPDYWVEFMHTELRAAEKAEAKRLDTKHPSGLFYETLVLIDDVRYQNEIDLVRKWGGTLVFVDAFRRLGLSEEWGDLPDWRKDPSEDVAWEYTMGTVDDEVFDYVITNNEDMDTLKDGIEAMLPIWTGEIPDVHG